MRAKAEASLNSLFRYCYDEDDQFFYDRDRNDGLVRVQSDVLLRVMACEVGDAELFGNMLRRYLLNTGKFFAKYPFTSMAMDDPRFDPSSSYNSWGGPSNFLSLIRAPHAFEHHHRYVELTWVLQPILSALSKAKRFPQTLSPWTGAEGFTEAYSPPFCACWITWNGSAASCRSDRIDCRLRDCFRSIWTMAKKSPATRPIAEL